MNALKPKGPVFDQGICRCCGDVKRCRVLNSVYDYCGQKEIYSEMLMDCFGFLLSYMEEKPAERLVCATCVVRLRDALSFRKQVLECEKAYLQMKLYDEGNIDCNMPEHVKVEVVLLEPELRSASAEDMYAENLGEISSNDNSNDEKPLMLLASNRIELTKKKPSVSKRTVNKLVVNKLRSKKQLQTVKNKVKSKSTQPISKSGQDQTYHTINRNMVTIVENSHVCPFTCSHNHLLCYYCKEILNDGESLRQHTALKHHPKRFKVTHHTRMIKIDITHVDCRLCAVKIDSLEVFKRHIVEVHNKEYNFKVKDLILPFKLSDNEKVNLCVICDASFPYFHALNKHMNKHFSNYVCETCGLGFVDKGRSVVHQRTHDSTNYPCELCGKVFANDNYRKQHVDRIHNKIGRLTCPKCDARFISFQQKVKHLELVHGEAKEFPCEACPNVYPTRRKLTYHCRKDHLKDYRYQCEICGKKFFTRFALNHLHMPSHTGERNFKCQVCEKTYPRLKTLNHHLKRSNCGKVNKNKTT